MPPEGDNPPGDNPPVILYTGGGPGGMRASVFCLEFQVYAARGYAVINCNARGNYGYGEPFSMATKGNWGDLDGDDNMAYLRDVCEHFPVDKTRTAVAGGSYGGYMATWLMCRHPEAFNAAVVDRSLMSRFVGTSDFGYLLEKVEFDGKFAWDDLERYLHRSPITHIGSAKTPTLVVHSALDHRCPVNQGEQLYAALTYLGVPTKLVRFPNETHDLSRAGRPWHRVFRMDKYLEWFAKYLRA
jgi:dipeptidyl aminopeptidase/acylaminoacyl peptidase